jgi:hypothetical protein
MVLKYDEESSTEPIGCFPPFPVFSVELSSTTRSGAAAIKTAWKQHNDSGRAAINNGGKRVWAAGDPPFLSRLHAHARAYVQRSDHDEFRANYARAYWAANSALFAQ